MSLRFNKASTIQLAGRDFCGMDFDAGVRRACDRAAANVKSAAHWQSLRLSAVSRIQIICKRAARRIPERRY
jgi:hypothetical protein